jgi:hypothetical protein
MLAGAAAVVLLAVLVLSGGEQADDRPGRTGVAPADDEERPEEATVAPLRGLPWLDRAVDVRVVVAGPGGRLWLVDVGAATVTDRRLAQDEPAHLPLSAVIGDHLVTRSDGRIVAVPLDGGEAVDLGAADRRIPEPVAFRSERPDTVWVLEPAEPGSDASTVVATERTLDGERIRTAATPFPMFSGPVAATTGGLLAHGEGRDVDDLHVVDVETGARRLLTTIPHDSMLLAAHGPTVVLSGPPCEPGCSLTIVDATTGEQRAIAAPEGAGVRSAEGSLSPDGASLVYSVSTTLPDDPRPRYAVVDLASGASRLSDVAVGPGVAWSAGGDAFVAAPARRRGRGADTRLVVHHLATAVTEELPVLVRIPLGQPWVLGG